MSVVTFTAAQLLRLLPRRRLSRAIGKLCDRPLPPAVSNTVATAYIKAYGVDMTDVAPRSGAYPSFDAFFTRPLRAGSRAISDAPVVCPADGRLLESGRIDPGMRLRVKKSTYALSELLGEERSLKRYGGGAFAVIYLSPRDYHRVHSPVDGRLTVVRFFPGDLFPVNSIGERHVPNLFVRNERVALFIETEHLGRVAVVMVGAMVVGRMTVSAVGGTPLRGGDHELDPPQPVRRGDEIGIFHLGSTVVVLVEPPVALSQRRGPIRYGESLVDGS